MKDTDSTKFIDTTHKSERPKVEKLYELSNIDQLEEGAGLSYTNEGHGLWTKFNDTTHKSERPTVEKL